MIADLINRFRSRFATYTPVVHLLEDPATGAPINQEGSNGAAHVTETGVVGGERNTSSGSNNYDAVHEEVNKTLFNPDATTEQVISAVPCFVYGFMGRTGTGTLTIRDSATAAGATSDFPAFTLAVGTPVMLCGGAAVRFENGLTAQCGTGTDDCVIFWRPI